MKISVLLVGNELLDGRISDRNLQYLTEHIQSTQSSILDVVVVKDSIKEIARALHFARSEIVIVSGGLGPTSDDLTREGASLFLGRPLEEDPIQLARIKDFFDARGRSFSVKNRRQASKPHGSQWIQNPIGTAPGFYFQHNAQRFYFFPGVPKEFQAMVDAFILPVIKKNHESSKQNVSQRIYVHGIAESSFEELLEPFSPHIQVGFRAMGHSIELKMTGPSEDIVNEVWRVVDLCEPYLIGVNRSIEEEVGYKLLSRGETISTAESCTGGLLAAKITDVPGASLYFTDGYVTYANEAKIRLLGVSEEALNTYGAVSREVVGAMAYGARKCAQTDWCLAVSGIAGPTGGSEDKPIGYVTFGLARPNKTYTMTRCFGNIGRSAVRERSVVAALHLLLCALDGRPFPKGVQEVV